MKALVTGANGFIGSHLAEKLFKMGYDVSCLVRNTSDLKWLEGLDIKLIKGNCSDEDSLKNCMKNYDYIFHLAGLTKTNCKDDFYSVNTKGTEDIVKSVAKNNPNVQRFVYLSSLSAFGPKLNVNVSGEKQNPQPVSDYGKSKLKGEEAILKYGDKIPVTILRPAAVYGPRDKDFFLIFKFIKKGIMPYWGDGRISLIYIDDLIDAILLSAKTESAVGETYPLSDGITYSNNEVIKEISSALDIKVFKIQLPRSVLPTIGFFAERISKIMGTSSMINSDKVKELKYTDWICDITKATDNLGFKPKIGLKEGIQWTVNWYRIHKWL